jgi:hypothetical protein
VDTAVVHSRVRYAFLMGFSPGFVFYLSGFSSLFYMILTSYLLGFGSWLLGGVGIIYFLAFSVLLRHGVAKGGCFFIIKYLL